ncbi:DUF6318 family protein [Arthrobacter sp. 35W]|uniref:DUF6318 family protein n=1 Tax=Arthrobacter sp. 35W TaxID=1132441 RepID=UPI0012DCF437|nr:DUF6318 family protein [Arthrobacter sp. 35W]
MYKPADASGPAQNVPVPVKPAIADEFSKEGIEAFAKYWYATLDYAYESGDLGPLGAITGPNCEACAGATKTVTKWFSDGRWIAGGRFDISATQSKFVETDEGLYQVIIQLKLEEASFYGTDGKLSNTVPASALLGDIIEARHDGHTWKAENVAHMFGAGS